MNWFKGKGHLAVLLVNKGFIFMFISNSSDTKNIYRIFRGSGRVWSEHVWFFFLSAIQTLPFFELAIFASSFHLYFSILRFFIGFSWGFFPRCCSCVASHITVVFFCSRLKANIGIDTKIHSLYFIRSRYKFIFISLTIDQRII